MADASTDHAHLRFEELRLNSSLALEQYDRRSSTPASRPLLQQLDRARLEEVATPA